MPDAAPVEADDGDLSTLADMAFTRIMDLILTGTLQPGAVANEAELAKQFGMSRGPVREAIRRVQGQKLITREAFQRARVVELGVKEMIEIFQLREALEAMSCRLATTAMSDSQIDEMLAILDPTSNRSYPPDFDFHIVLAQACGNGRIADLLCNEALQPAAPLSAPLGHAAGPPSVARRAGEIARAMRARDADLAESLMRQSYPASSTPCGRRWGPEEFATSVFGSYDLSLSGRSCTVNPRKPLVFTVTARSAPVSGCSRAGSR